MNLFGNIVLFSAIPMILLLFAWLPPRRALIAATIIFWLFLPNAIFRIPGFPDYTKTSATTVGTFLGALLFDSSRMTRFRPKWFDIPILVWCFGNVVTSVSNDLGVYDGLSASSFVFLLWVLPYFLGRLYFSDHEGLQELAMGIVLGAMVYVPLCLFENRMSPIVYQVCYGVSRYTEPPRFGWGYRPILFLATGLEVAVWMGAGTLCSYSIWRAGEVRRLFGVNFRWFVLAISATTMMTMSVGAIILTAGGVALIELVRLTKRSVLVWVLILTPPLYMVVRTSGLWNGRSMVELTERYLPDRRSSIDLRVRSENLLIEKALMRPLFGWGGFSRSDIYDKSGKQVAIKDGYWVLILGIQGLVGLSAFAMTFMLPQMLFYKRIPGRLWGTPECAAAFALSVLVGLFLVDSLSNAMPNPTYGLALGGLTALTTAGLASSRRIAAERLTEAVGLKEYGHHDRAEASLLNAIESYAASNEVMRRDPETLVEAAYAFEALADLYAAAPNRIGEAETALLHAVEVHEALVADHPGHYDSFERLAVDLEHLGRIQGAQGRLEEAQQNWNRALEIRQALAAELPASPDFTKRWAESQNDLAWLLSSHSASVETAVELAVKAVELEPERASFWNTLGLANYQLGDLETATHALRRSVELGEGGTGFDHYLLAIIAGRLGQFNEARASFLFAEDWTRANAPDHPELARLRSQCVAVLDFNREQPALEHH